MTVQTYQVTGMTCGHCVGAVTQELSALEGVTSVDVDLKTGEVTVDSGEPLDIDKVREATEEAGYTLAGTVGLCGPTRRFKNYCRWESVPWCWPYWPVS
ncbi:copper chaperone CopZ [Stackebrandtia endophytica]|uniref:Copper chaperone CopZ n=1 Tax=Stackebrandtia endophytica TaxID=1496996 RepID=A0A543AWF0_9ACTN|nr:heavy-metal-associated domain-containing protein [Stackebrandtia endophytica]TQL76905.1 copper chaperone CopZ [Stackebrandtia endophytica]